MTKGFVRLTGIAMVALVLTMILAVASFSQSSQSHPAEGTYNVTVVSGEIGTINFLIVFKRNGDKWSGEIKDSPIPLAVTTVSLDENNKITVVADAGGTPVTINGKLDGNKLAGDFTAGDLKGTWTALKKDDALKPAEKVVATASSGTPAAGGSSSASAAAAAGIEGTYDAKIIVDGQGELPFTLVIKRDGDKLVTSVENAGDLNVVAIEIKDPDVVNLSITFQGSPFQLPGKRTGDELGGKWETGGFKGTWTAKKK